MISKTLKFRVLSEDWQHYRLEDGSIVRIKAPLSRVIDSGQRDPEKGILLKFDIDSVVRVDADTGQRGAPRRAYREDEDGNIFFQLLEESVQVYYLYEIRRILIVKPTIKAIKPTSEYDELGFPIFAIESRIEILPVPLQPLPSSPPPPPPPSLS